MKKCHNCGEKINKNKSFCTHCGAEQRVVEDIKLINNDSNGKHKKFYIAFTIVFIIIVGGILAKKTCMYNYYTYKASNESSVDKSIYYYKKAMKIKYSDDLLKRLEAELKKSDAPENVIIEFKDILSGNNLKDLYMKIYLHKARENFKEKHYETVWNYLKKAESKGYDINNFEYYGDLKKIKEDEEFSDYIDLQEDSYLSDG